MVADLDEPAALLERAVVDGCRRQVMTGMVEASGPEHRLLPVATSIQKGAGSARASASSCGARMTRTAIKASATTAWATPSGLPPDRQGRTRGRRLPRIG